MIYLASPYSHFDPFVREERFLRACKAVAYLLEQQKWVYSPVVHCHQIAMLAELPKEFDFWKEYNFHMLSQSKELKILRIDGWERSQGIAAEHAFAEKNEIPVSYL